MKNHEVSNEDYRMYLEVLKQENNAESLRQARVRNEQWEHQLNAKDYAEHYHVHPAYSDYPVVNVTYLGALGYCDYMTKKLNTLMRKTGIQVKVRLPFDIEIIRAGIADNHRWVYPWEGDAFVNKKGEALSNHKGNAANHVHSKKGKVGPITTKGYLMPVQSFLPSPLGVFNLSGNAAEMINVPGVAVGGSFLDAGSDAKLTSKTTYEESSCAVGFRVVFTWQAE